MKLLVAHAVGTRAGATLNIDDAMPRDAAVIGKRVEGVANEAGMTGKTREERDLAVGGDAAARNAPNDSEDERMRGGGGRHGCVRAMPNVWHQRRAKRVRCMPGLGFGPAAWGRMSEETARGALTTLLAAFSDGHTGDEACLDRDWALPVVMNEGDIEDVLAERPGCETDGLRIPHWVAGCFGRQQGSRFAEDADCSGKGLVEKNAVLAIEPVKSHPNFPLRSHRNFPPPGVM